MFSQNLVFNGLGTLSITMGVAGLCFADGHIALPTISNGGGVSACLVTINQNGSPIYTGQAGAEGFYVNFTAAVGDVIAFVFSSSAAADQPLNVIKSSISIGTGT